MDSGLWIAALELLRPAVRGALRFIDSTLVKVHGAGCNPAGGQEAQAMGRSRGGLTTKLHAIVDEARMPVCLALSCGHHADLRWAAELASTLPEGCELIGDKGFDSQKLRRWLWQERGVQSSIPHRLGFPAPAHFAPEHYRKRHVVENFFAALKKHRRIATRYDKLQSTFFGFVCLATVISMLD